MPDKPNTDEPQKPRRRWFQFRLRTLLIVVVLLAIPLGYVGHEAYIARERVAIRIWSVYADRVAWIKPKHDTWGSDSSFLVRRLFGDVEVGSIWIPTKPGVSDEQQQRIRELFPEAQLASFDTNGN
jgi:hypothetical protein